MKPTYEELEQQVLELAVQLANAESKCRELAAENAGLKESECEFKEYCRQECESAGDTWVDDFTETPATDAFLAEVRNEAGARAVELFSQTLGSPYTVRDEKCYEDGFTRAIEVVRNIQAPRFAAQLRKGGAA